MRLLINHQATVAMIMTAAAIAAMSHQLIGGGGVTGMGVGVGVGDTVGTGGFGVGVGDTVGTGVGGVGGVGGGGALTVKEPVTPLTSTLWTPAVSLVVVKVTLLLALPFTLTCFVSTVAPSTLSVTSYVPFKLPVLLTVMPMVTVWPGLTSVGAMVSKLGVKAAGRR